MSATVPVLALCSLLAQRGTNLPFRVRNLCNKLQESALDPCCNMSVH